MRGLNLGPSATINNLQARNGAGIAVSGSNGFREGCVPEGPRREPFDDGSVERSRLLGGPGETEAGRHPFHRGGRRKERLKARSHYQVKFSIRDRPNCPTKRSFAGAAIRALQASLIVVIAFPKRHRSVELEKISDETIEVIRDTRVCLNSCDACGCEVCLTSTATPKISADASGFVVDNPIPYGGLYLPE
ncbi:MAG: hypothetical protein WA709_27130, partial [Stellaceae bacterium]